MNKLFNIIIAVLTIVEAILIYLWITEDGAGNEPIFTLINTLLIPLIFYFRDRFKDNYRETDRLEIIIDSCKIKYLNESGVYYAQTNLKFKSFDDKITIEKILLKAKFDYELSGSPYSRDGLRILGLYQYQHTDLLTLDPEEFLRIKATLKETATEVNMIEIEPGSLKSYSIIGILESERLPDGYEYFKMSNWKFEAYYNGNKMLAKEIPWEVHPNSSKIPIEYKFDGFDL